MTPALLFVARYVALFAAILVVADGIGRVALRREPWAVRTALGLAIAGQVLVLFALAGVLTRGVVIAFAIVSVGAWAIFVRKQDAFAVRWTVVLLAGLLLIPMLAMALLPPLAFDETLYHLPFTRAIAESGRLQFHAGMRFPVFPQLHEVLAAPLFLGGGAIATHLLALASFCVLSALVFDWTRRRLPGSGPLAAALLAGSPAVILLATVHYVEILLALFIAAGVYALDRSSDGADAWLTASGFFLGSAASVKYLGLFFAFAGGAAVLLRPHRRARLVLLFGIGLLTALLPTYAWISATTGNPLFPYAPGLFGASAWTPGSEDATLTQRLARSITAPWNATFARHRVNQQPPFTPMLIPILVTVAIAAARNRFARGVFLLSVVYLLVFAWLPQDSRYLVPLLPLLAVAAAPELVALAKRFGVSRTVPTLALLIALPGFAYALYRVIRVGLPPATSQGQQAFLRSRVPEYRALERARGPVYACGAEQLKGLTTHQLYGDHVGPWSFARVVGPKIGGTLERIGVREILVGSPCFPFTPPEEFKLVYEDEAARLFRR